MPTNGTTPTDDSGRTRQGVVHLDIKNADGRVMIAPRDENRFGLTVKHAITACQIFQNAKDFKEAFQVMLQRLAEWVTEKSSKIDTAFVTARGHHFEFLIVQKGTAFDSELEDAMSALDIELANDPLLKEIELHTTCLPHAARESIDSFLGSQVFSFSPASAQGL